MIQSSAEAGRLPREFTDEMYTSYRYLARTPRYWAKSFLEMVTMHEGVGAAQILLRGPRASDGFARLWKEKLLQHRVEAAGLKQTYEQLFTDDEWQAARFRLEEHDFDVDVFLAALER